MKLLIGSGETTRNARQGGWVTLDPDPVVEADIVASVPPLPDEVTGQQWERIEMIHVIEHMTIHEARRLLPELYSVLAPGGLLVLEAPDIKQAARYLLGILRKETNKPFDPVFFDMFAIYGDQRRDNPYYQHKWGYWPESLSVECREAGFDEVNALPALYHWPWRDFRIEAKKR